MCIRAHAVERGKRSTTLSLLGLRLLRQRRRRRRATTRRKRGCFFPHVGRTTPTHHIFSSLLSITEGNARIVIKAWVVALFRRRFEEGTEDRAASRKTGTLNSGFLESGPFLRCNAGTKAEESSPPFYVTNKKQRDKSLISVFV